MGIVGVAGTPWPGVASVPPRSVSHQMPVLEEETPPVADHQAERQWAQKLGGTVVPHRQADSQGPGSGQARHHDPGAVGGRHGGLGRQHPEVVQAVQSRPLLLGLEHGSS